MEEEEENREACIVGWEYGASYQLGEVKKKGEMSAMQVMYLLQWKVGGGEAVEEAGAVTVWWDRQLAQRWEAQLMALADWNVFDQTVE